jgi:hypothetical protein
MPIFLISFVSATECGITNLASCLSQSFFEFLLSIINAPIQPLLDLIYSLLTKPVNTSLFSGIWGIIVYMLSMFYGILLLYIGFKFIISGHSPEEREKAKKMLTNVIIMMVLVQASYYLYALIIELIASMTTAVFNMIPQDFFRLTIDNLSNLGLELFLTMPYLLCLLIMIIILVIRYLIVSVGVIFFAIGIFLYFIEPLNHYGKLIINFLVVTISLTFFYSLIFLASSKLLDVGFFADFKILVMIGAFALVNGTTIFIALFVIIKSALKIVSPITKVISVVGAIAGG